MIASDIGFSVEYSTKSNTLDIQIHSFSQAKYILNMTNWVQHLVLDWFIVIMILNADVTCVFFTEDNTSFKPCGF